MHAACRVVLWSPGCRHHDGGNTGLPHLVALGSYVAARNGAQVAIIDRDYESRSGRTDTAFLLAGDWDVIGFSCYSSFDYQVVMQVAHLLRPHFPRASFVVGGYHPSACPSDFLGPGTPFDHVVVGEGEIPLSQIIESIQAGRRVGAEVMGPSPLPSLDELPPLRWELLARYRELMVDPRLQLNINLSRGCPFPCEFCMERGKRSSQWRAYSPARAVSELWRLMEAFPRNGGVLRITDALFGMDRSWRHEVLASLARRRLPVNVVSSVTRSDLLENGDMARFHAAGVAVGFGIESGDPEMLRIIRKTSEPGRFLERFAAQVHEAEALGMPWGANLIAGHPGETPESLARSAQWFTQLVDQLDRTSGHLSIDPYRYYPGSAVYLRIAEYEQHFGTRVHAPSWWRGENPTAESMRVDASRELPWEERDRLRVQLFHPVLSRLLHQFSYRGPEREYFCAALQEDCAAMRNESDALALNESSPAGARPPASRRECARPPVPPAGLGTATVFEPACPACSAWVDLVFHVLSQVEVAPGDHSSLFSAAYTHWCRRNLPGLEHTLSQKNHTGLSALYRATSFSHLLHLFPVLWDSVDAFMEASSLRFKSVSWSTPEQAETAEHLVRHLPELLLERFREALRQTAEAGFANAWNTRLRRAEEAFAPRLRADIAALSAVMPGLDRAGWRVSFPLRSHGRIIHFGSAEPRIFVGVPNPALHVEPNHPLIQGCHEFLVWREQTASPQPEAQSTVPGTMEYARFMEAETRALAEGERLLGSGTWREAYWRWRAATRCHAA